MHARTFVSKALAASLLCLPPVGDGAVPLACHLSPAGAHVVLLELFSAEGCDSCPPADHRFSALQPDAQQVPLVWHVDYFDSLNWVDRFALPASTQRQRRLVRASGSPAVVTPQVFIEGAAFSAWRDERAFRSRLVRQAHRPARVAMVLHNIHRDGGQLEFEVRALSAPGGAPIQLQAALLESGLVTVVTEGENKGLTLKHDHVVRASAGPVAGPGPWRTQVPLPQPPPADLTLVLWAQDEAGQPLNASWARCTL